METRILDVFPEGYKWVVLTASLLCIECFLLGLIFINGTRKRFFTREYLDRNYGETANREFGAPPSNGGYPDAGNGLHSTAWSLEQWFNFNTAMRGHLNFVENLPAMVILTLFSGIFYPKIVFWLGLAHILFRLLFILGYVANPAYRSFGFLPMLLVLLAQIVLIIIGLWKLFFPPK